MPKRVWLTVWQACRFNLSRVTPCLLPHLSYLGPPPRTLDLVAGGGFAGSGSFRVVGRGVGGVATTLSAFFSDGAADRGSITGERGRALVGVSGLVLVLGCGVSFQHETLA